MAFIKYTIFNVLLAGLITAGLIYSLPDNRFHIYFLDVGQGDSILIKSPDSRYILIDAGPNNRTTKLIGEIIGNFQRRIDLVILTHPHADHFTGLNDIVKKYEIGLMILSRAPSPDPLYSSLLREFSIRNIKTIFMPDRLDINFGAGIYIDSIIAKCDGGRRTDANECSLMFRILYGKLSILIAGDAPAEEEFTALHTNFDLRADILKISHHGSKTSTSEEFLSASKPAISVIQSGIKNRFGHPAAETISRLQKFSSQIFRNDTLGTIEFIF